LRIAVYMYMTEPEGEAPGRFPATVSVALGLAAVVTILGGVFPDTLATWTVPPLR
jgi:NADH:ubiquinone oxidoreductase subunit 2 (subunit N)